MLLLRRTEARSRSAGIAPPPRGGSSLSCWAAFAFTAPLGLVNPMTRTHVRLLGPCFKTGRRGDRRRPLATDVAGTTSARLNDTPYEACTQSPDGRPDETSARTRGDVNPRSASRTLPTTDYNTHSRSSGHLSDRLITTQTGRRRQTGESATTDGAAHARGESLRRSHDAEARAST